MMCRRSELAGSSLVTYLWGAFQSPLFAGRLPSPYRPRDAIERPASGTLAGAFMPSSSSLRSASRVARVALAAFLAVVLPDAAALRDPAPAPAVSAVSSGADKAPPALAPRYGEGDLELARQLAQQRLQGLGLPSADAWRLIDATCELAGRGEALDAVEVEVDARLDGGADSEAIAALRLVAERTSPVAPTLSPEELVHLMSMDEILPDRAPLPLTANGSSGAALRLAPPSVTLPSAPTPRFNGTCQACPNFDFGFFTPTVAWQSHSSSTCCVNRDCNWYCFNVTAGDRFEFKTCGPEGSATFDSVLDLFNPSGCGFLATANNTCGQQELLSWTATYTGEVRVRVRGAGGVFGDYTLAYRKICVGGTSCASPDNVLGVPTTACQYQDGAISDCSGSAFFNVTLLHGQTYTFTLCPSTCANAFADFDSAVELSLGGSVLASNGSACGDDGEVVYSTDPMTGDGTYCVRVIRESGSTTAFRLGYRVACQAPSNVTIGPATAGTTAADCSHRQTFNVTTAGTGPFTYDWSIAATPGHSASPSSGSDTSNLTSEQFTSLLMGSGDYQVTVTVSNECGSQTQVLTYTLQDRAGPTLTPSADAGGCLQSGSASNAATTTSAAPGSGADATPIRRAFDISRDELQHILLQSSDTAIVRSALAAKLGVMPDRIMVVDGRDPLFFRPPTADALSCPTPCTFGNIGVNNSFYDVFLTCGDGSFTARTGASHSVTTSSGSKQNVIFGGSGGSPGTSDVTFYIHTTNTEYLQPSGGQACSFDPADTPSEQNSLGVEEEWRESPGAGIDLRLREEIVSFGATEPDSGVRLTLGIQNLPSSTRSVNSGVRWQIDYQNASDDGPLFARVRCSPFEVFDERSTEHELTAAEIAGADFYRIQNNTGSPVFGNFSSTTAIAGFDDTGTPDRLIYGSWPSLVGSGWGYVANEGNPNPDNDSAVLYYYGFDPANGITVAPGESFTRSVIIFTAGDAHDCGALRPGTCTAANVTICPNACARVGATAVDNCGSATVSLLSASPGAPPCVGNPCTAVFPDEGTFVYTWQASDDAGNRVECTSTVNVRASAACNAPPTCSAGGPYASSCRVAPIDGASVQDPDNDPIAYTWTSDNASVTVSPDSGVVPGSPGARGIPPAVARLADDVAPCGVSATLTLTVNDGRGGSSSCRTTVTFSDTEAPVIAAPPEATVECDAVPPPAVVGALDACDAAPAVSFSEARVDGDCPGRYTLVRTWTATDHCSNVASSSQTIHVQDTTPPVVTPGSGVIACMWPPNHWYVCFRSGDLLPDVHDACSEPVTWRVAGCSSDQPDDAPESGSGWNGDGHTVDDCVVDPDGQGFCVRSERCGAGPTAQDGRHYGVSIVAVDACGNASAAVVIGSVHVPHDQSPMERNGCRNPTKDGQRILGMGAMLSPVHAGAPPAAAPEPGDATGSTTRVLRHRRGF